MDWDDLRYFTAVARVGGLSGAARALRTSPQTVGRRIAALEAGLGITLFFRHPSGYRLTADGRAVLADAEQAEEAMARLRTNATCRTAAISGTVRLAAPETITTHLLLPRLRPLLDRHPALELELITGIAPIGIARGEADIALRLVRPARGALTVRQVGHMAHACFVAPGFAKPTDLSHATRLVGWTADFGHLPAAQWLSKTTGRIPDVRFSSLEAQRAAITARIGIGMLPCFLGDGLDVSDTPFSPVEPLWLVTHTTDFPADRVRLVYEAVAEIITEFAHLLSGSPKKNTGVV